MLSSLLTQFRQQYPQGSLTSDLLTIHDGLYLVRVCVGAEGVTLACGLSAHTALEQAEDLATARALERVGMEPASGAAIAAPEASTALAPAETAPTSGVPRPPLSAIALLPEPDHASKAPVLGASPISLAIPPVPKAMPPEPEAAPAIPDNFADDLINLGTESVASVDLSDIIAQTDVELQRLGWDVNHGREFLEKTYGKRSRHDLTDDELLEFLLYLETQSPSGNL